MACPHVAGTVALIISQAKSYGLTLNTTQILAILQDTATPLKCPAAEPYIPFVRGRVQWHLHDDWQCPAAHRRPNSGPKPDPRQLDIGHLTYTPSLRP